MTQEDIDSLVESFNDDKLQDLSDDEKAYILNCVQDPKEASKLEAGIDRVLDDFEGEKYVDLFSESIEELSSDEVNSYLSKGEKPEVVTEADWGVKKIKIVEGLKTNSEEIRKLGGGRIELNAEVLKLVSRELASMEDDCSPMVDDLSDKVTEQMISDKVEMSGGNIQALAVEHARAIQTLQNQLDSANERSTRMVKLIDIMKERIASMAAVESKMKEQDAELKLKEASPDDQITYLRLQLKGALSEVRNRESTIEKIRASTDKIVQLKDLEIQKLSRAPKPFVPNDEGIDKTEMEPIQIHGPDDEVPGPTSETEGDGGNSGELGAENKNLKMQLEIMSNRLSRLNENMEARTKQAVQKSEADILKLRRDNQSAISTINKLREEKERINRLFKKSQQSLSMMEENVRLLKIEISHKKDEKAEKVEAVSNSSDEKVIKELQIKERKFTELLKEAGLKIKSYEQKIKFMQAQVNASQRPGPGKKQGGAGQFGANAGNNDQKFQLKIRQLETLKGRAEEAHKKALADLNGVKKDNVLLKQELNATKLKLDDVEKKLGKLAS